MFSDDEGRPRKRRVERACDACSRKKIRCNGSGADSEAGRCLNCAKTNLDCTYYGTNTRKRAAPEGFVDYLQERLEKAESMLQKLHPELDLSVVLGPSYDRDSWPRRGTSEPSKSGAPSSQSLYTPFPRPQNGVVLARSETSIASEPVRDEVASSDDETVTGVRGLEAHLRGLDLDPMNARYMGKSSGTTFVKFALAVKEELAGASVHAADRGLQKPFEAVLARRSEYWQMHEWEMQASAPALGRNLRTAVVPDKGSLFSESVFGVPPSSHAPCAFTYPPDDLLPTLIDAYFACINVVIPLLHRPTFERALAELAHHNHPGFGAVLLLVCAVGARFVDDERVLLDGATGLSAGWKWFNQVPLMRRSILALPGLHDLQICCLSAVFLQGSCALGQAAWSIVGTGIRLAVDVGAHRKNLYSDTPTVHDELWRRAFWVLVILDRSISSVCGRPCALQDEDMDIGLPTDCDDEFWENEDPACAFRQPSGKPSKVFAFISLIKLHDILAFASRTIYSINKSKSILGLVGQDSEQRIVSELDSKMNEWFDAIPDHLRWDPEQEDLALLDQSAYLYATYYQLQIMVHRPFIRARHGVPASFPSLAICTNAARACAKVVYQHFARVGRVMPKGIPAAFTSGVVLLLSIWSRRTGSTFDPTKDMAEVYKCMTVLKACEERWQVSGRMWDLLAHLASMSEVLLPPQTQKTTRKRDREPEPEQPSDLSVGSPSMPVQGRAAPFPLPAPALAASQPTLDTAAFDNSSFGSALHTGAYGSPSLFESPALGNPASYTAPGPGTSSYEQGHIFGQPMMLHQGDVAETHGGAYAPALALYSADSNDLGAFGTALDGLFSESSAVLPGDDAFAMWMQTPMLSDNWTQYSHGTDRGTPPNNFHSR